MPCPLFIPETAIPGSAAASPLGSIFSGFCAGHGKADEVLLQQCNSGYARKACATAAGLEADAVRFRIRSHSNGIVQIAWSAERDHLPVAVGVLDLNEAAVPLAPPLERQARACAGIYIQRTGTAW